MKLEKTISFKGVDLKITVDYSAIHECLEVEEIEYYDFDVYEIYESLNLIDDIRERFQEEFDWVEYSSYN